MYYSNDKKKTESEWVSDFCFCRPHGTTGYRQNQSIGWPLNETEKKSRFCYDEHSEFRDVTWGSL